MGTAILVASGKGGTGKTSFLRQCRRRVNVQWAKRSCSFDADAGLRSLDLVLGMADSLLFSYADVARGDALLKEAAVPPPHCPEPARADGAGRSCPAQRNPGRHSSARSSAAARAIILLMSLSTAPPGWGAKSTAFAPAAQRAVIVSTADALALRGAQKASQTLRQAGVPEAHIVVNRIRRGMIDAGAAVNIDRAMDASGLSLLGAVPEDDDVAVCAGRGQILLLESEGDGQQAYWNIARRLRGERVPLLDGLRGQYQ